MSTPPHVRAWLTQAAANHTPATIDDPDRLRARIQGAAMTTTTDRTESPINAAERLAPTPATRDDATRHAWVRYYAARGLGCWATFRAEIRNLTPNPVPGSRPDLGYLALAAVASTSAAVALLGPNDAPGWIWDLTPEAGALNGEWEEWLTDVLVRYGINPGHIDPDLDPADFTPADRTEVPA